MDIQVDFDSTNSLIGSDISVAKRVVGMDVTDTSGDDLLTLVSNAAFGICNKETNRKLKSRTLTEVYDGDREACLYTNEYPITAITRLAYGRKGVIKINNSSTTSTATVSVSSTGLTLILDGSSDKTVLFATYTTITAVVDAVNALGSNWQATLAATAYANIKSTELIRKFGASCLDTEWAYLEMPNEYITDYYVEEDIGEIYYSAGFPSGTRNIYLDYTGGLATIPASLEDACLQIILYLWQNYDERKFRVISRSVGDGSVTIENADIPKSALMQLAKYRKRLF